jgi:glucose-1-phosphate cytidylyltransferase
VILAGGRGSRLSEETKIVPKPMVLLDRDPILMHIMEYYKKQGFNQFIILCGYKKEIIYNYFTNLNNCEINLKIDNNKVRKSDNYDLDVTLLDTGLNSSTAKRILNVKDHIGDKFMMTYGDGLSDVNLRKLISFHIKHKKIGTVTAVRPPARFGSLKIQNNFVIEFKEKNQILNSWINGGFFVFNQKIFNFFTNVDLSFEDSVLTNLAKVKELSAYKHFGFWKPMDTLREKEELKEMIQMNKMPWKLDV